jgi:hypothetical protein
MCAIVNFDVEPCSEWAAPMLSPKPCGRPAPISRQPRGVVVVDGSSGGFRALAWAGGYARARRLDSLDVLLYPRALNRFNDACRAASFPFALMPDLDDAAGRTELENTASQICRDNDLWPRIRHSSQRSWQDLARTLCQEQPDFVVLGRVETLSRWSSQQAVSQLTKNGISVTVVP